MSVPAPARGLLLPILFVVGWSLAASSGAAPRQFLPSPGDVLGGWWTWAFGEGSELSWTSGTFFSFSLLSLHRVLIGFAIGASFGIALGLVIGWSQVSGQVIDPLIQALKPVPTAAWLPFATLVFGIQEPAAVFLIAFGCFFPVVLSTASGVRQTPQLLVRAALMLGTSRHRLPIRVALPAALPSILVGLRLGLATAWVLVIVAEMLAVKGGLGYAIWSAYTFLRMDLMIAVIIAMAIYGWLTDLLLVAAGRRALRWQRGLVRS